MLSERGASGTLSLLVRTFDFKNIGSLGWLVALPAFNAGIFLLSYGVERLCVADVQAPDIAIPHILALCGMFFAAAVAEELGWSVYALDLSRVRWGVLEAGIPLGSVWAAWHFVALARIGRSLEWIAGWPLRTVAARMIMVSLYDRTGASVFSSALFHACSNVCWQIYPVDGSRLDHRITGLITAGAALSVALCCPRPGVSARERMGPT